MRTSRPALEKNMKIIRAEHLGMCFGVKDAIALALGAAKHSPLTILGDLVHNETVLAELRAQGIRIEQQPADVSTRTVMVTAHGASERAIARNARTWPERPRSHLSAGARCPSQPGKAGA